MFSKGKFEKFVIFLEVAYELVPIANVVDWFL